MLVNPDRCQQSNLVVLARENPSRKEFYSAILASKMSHSGKAYLGGRQLHYKKGDKV
jgi:hypothetical protein